MSWKPRVPQKLSLEELKTFVSEAGFEVSESQWDSLMLRRDLEKMAESWNEIVGTLLAVHSRPAFFRDGELQILCDNAIYAQEIQFSSRHIQEKVANRLGIRVQKTHVRVVANIGPSQKSPRSEKKSGDIMSLSDNLAAIDEEYANFLRKLDQL